MTTNTQLIRKIAVIVPTVESRTLYHSFFTPYTGFEFHDYSSFEEFNLDTINTGGCDGFIIDLRIILKANPEEKQFFYYIMDLFPSIRISHTPDMSIVSGDVKGRSFKNRPLFDFFFLKQFESAEKGKMNILLFVHESESLALYKTYIDTYTNVELRPFSSLSQFTATLTKKSRFSGVIVDFRTLMKANPDERVIFYELMDVFPAMRISHTLDKLTVKGSIKEKSIENHALFNYFFNELCRNFTPKGIRCSKRFPLFLNILLKTSELFEHGEAPEAKATVVRVNTVNVSEGGLFIHTNLPFKEDQLFTLVINELSDHAPIQCKMKWLLPWGESMVHLPGFGAEFTAIKPNQLEELSFLIKGKK